MPELWLRKIFPKTVFVSTDMPEKRPRVAKSQNINIYKSNLIERYSLRPINIVSLNNMCLAEFAAYYYQDYKNDLSETADAQPDNIIEQVNMESNKKYFPGTIRLINGTEVMKCRKVKSRHKISYSKQDKRT